MNMLTFSSLCFISTLFLIQNVAATDADSTTHEVLKPDENSDHDVCVAVLTTIKGSLQNAEIKEEILKEFHKVCEKLKILKSQCKKFVDKKIASILSVGAKKINPEKICDNLVKRQ